MFYLGSLFPALLVLTAVMIPESRVWYRLYAPDTKDEGGDGKPIMSSVCVRVIF